MYILIQSVTQLTPPNCRTGLGLRLQREVERSSVPRSTVTPSEKAGKPNKTTVFQI